MKDPVQIPVLLALSALLVWTSSRSGGAEPDWLVALLNGLAGLLALLAAWRALRWLQARRFGSDCVVSLDWRQCRRVVDAAIQAEGWTVERSSRSLELRLPGPEPPKYRFAVVYDVPFGFVLKGAKLKYRCSMGPRDSGRLYGFQLGKGETGSVSLENNGRWQHLSSRFDDAARLFVECKVDLATTAASGRTLADWSVSLRRPTVFLQRVGERSS